MRRIPIQNRIDRYDPLWIDAVVTEVIVPHDVIEVYGLRHSGPLIQFPRIGPEVRIVDNPFPVALEMQVIDEIEAEKGCSKTPVCLGDPISHEIAMSREPFFKPIQRVKQRANGCVIGRL